jgi:serine/threonine protein kinase
VNYEELIKSRDKLKTGKFRLPYGYFYKRNIDNKYTNFVEFHDELTDSIYFSGCIQRQCEALKHISNKCQIQFTPNEGDGIYAVAVEPGNYISFEQLLNDTPSILAKDDFIYSTISKLVDITTELNNEGIQYICYAPSNILARKSDSEVRLLLHGSFFLPTKLQDSIYDGLEEYIAPEVMSEGKADERSDVYSLGKFIDYLYSSSGLPFELKQVIKKATAESPEKRYPTVAALYSAMKSHRKVWKTSIVGLSAIVIALIIAGIFIDMHPNREPIEFVKPVEEPLDESLLDEGFNPYTELGPDADSATIANAVQDYLSNDSNRVGEKKIREFQAKAEQIFRKQYTKAADVILSKIYNNERMNNSEKNFMAVSREVMEELVEKQNELASSSSISNETARRIASEIIEQLTEKKKKALEKNYGFQKAEKTEEVKKEETNNKK